MNKTESLAEILKPLAEAGCPHCYWGDGIEPTEQENRTGVCSTCTGTHLDPRFEALRLRGVLHVHTAIETWQHGDLGGGSATQQSCKDVGCSGFDVDTSLGAIVRAAAACGYNIECAQSTGGWEICLSLQGDCVMAGIGDTPEEAAGKALVEAINAQRS